MNPPGLTRWICAWLDPNQVEKGCDFPDEPTFARQVVSDCQEHRVIGLLRAALRQNPRTACSGLLHWLEIPYLLEKERLALASEQAAEALIALRTAGVDCIVLKGWALVSTLYDGDASLRPTGDLDILIRPGDWRSACQALASFGYATSIPQPHPGYNQRFLGHEVLHTSGRLPVGLRCVPLPLAVPWAPVVEGWFERAQPFDFHDAHALCLAPEDNFVYLCAHLGLHHQYEPRLFRYVDLLRLACRGLDWTAVRVRAVRWKLALPLQRCIEQLEMLWPGCLDANERAACAALPVTGAESRLHAWSAGREPTAFSHLVVYLIAQPGWGERLAYLLQTAFPGPGYLRQRYGARSAWKGLSMRAGKTIQLIRRK
jgi:hypothetical protein